MNSTLNAAKLESVTGTNQHIQF